MARRKQYVLGNGTASNPNLTANGNIDFDWDGGNGTLIADGTFGAGTLSLLILGPGGNYISVGTPVTLTANGAGNFQCCAGRLRLALTGATAPVLSYVVAGIPTNNAG